ncbi:MAG TPA: hypothetical protein DD453_04460 [Alteromonas macleodii]|jgi:hypothetical protein|nr:hypothetical protein ACZ81_20610 [Alteromonas macleodii]MBS07593.1 hypothetical protein [Alteromonas sp.]OZB97224.1 hypothetical protein BBP29_18965 [Alteromonas macleodii]HAA96819.1 hypothetical protein [Alteromonas macleodii]HAM18506.1 hypothetical protein [Alteromonas macleodii]
MQKILSTPKTVKRFNQWKKDIANIDNYRAFLTVRQVNKVGRRHWLFCKRQRREVHLLSDAELYTYHKLLWRPGTIRVMEQFEATSSFHSHKLNSLKRIYNRLFYR